MSLCFQNGDTALKHAAINGLLLIAQILLQHGASMEDVNEVSVYSTTSTHHRYA